MSPREYKRYPAETREAAKRMRQDEGLSYEEIGRRLKVPGMTARRWTLGLGEDKPQKPKSPPKKKTAAAEKADLRARLIQQIIAEELTYEEAASIADVYPQTVRAWVWRYRSDHGLGRAPRKARERTTDLVAWGRQYRERNSSKAILARGQAARDGGAPRKEARWPTRDSELPAHLPYLVEERSWRGETTYMP